MAKRWYISNLCSITSCMIPNMPIFVVNSDSSKNGVYDVIMTSYHAIIQRKWLSDDIFRISVPWRVVWYQTCLCLLKLIFSCRIGNSRRGFSPSVSRCVSVSVPQLMQLFSLVSWWIATKLGMCIHPNMVLDEFKGIFDWAPFRGHFGLKT